MARGEDAIIIGTRNMTNTFNKFESCIPSQYLWGPSVLISASDHLSLDQRHCQCNCKLEQNLAFLHPKRGENK